MSFHLLFTGEAVGLGALQSAEYHLVLSQRLFLDLVNGSSPVGVPNHELLPVMDNDTFIKVNELVQRQVFQHLHFYHPLAVSEDLSLTLIPASKASSTVHAENHAMVNSAGTV